METISCPSCGEADHSELFVSQDKYSNDLAMWSVAKCPCGLQFVNPRPEYHEMAAYYPSFYSGPKGPPTGPERWYRSRLLKKQIRELMAVTGLTTGTLLDVGAGTGDRLEVIREKGFGADGVEPMNHARATDIRYNHLEDVPDGRTFYDAVLFYHTFEHLHDPIRTLSTTRSILKPNGWLVIEVPNCASIQARMLNRRWVAYDVPRDLFFYNPETLQEMAKGQRFRLSKLVHLQPFLHPPTIVLSLFPWLDPRLNWKAPRGITGALRSVLWSAATLCLGPIPFLEAILGRGSIMTAYFQMEAEPT